VPTGIELGDQTLQINGYDPDGAVRSVSLGVVSVVGFARGPQLRPQMTALSDARARNVSSYLRSLGVTGAHTIRGVWVVGGRPSTGMQVSISISYVP